MQMPIKLIDTLLAWNVPLNSNNYKIHLATSDVDPPLEAFFAGRFKKWQEYQTRKNFPCEHVISLIEISKHKWLFAGVYKILGCEKKSEKHFEYSTVLLPGQEDFVGRIIVRHERTGRQSYLRGDPAGGEFFICEIRERKLTIQEFPGYNSVLITHSKLSLIINQAIQSWYGALSNVKGIYLISDEKTGKLYVGSATGDGGIWQRWAGYTTNGHGGNKELRAVLKANDPGHEKYFRYSILEIADSHATDEYIVERESYWKNILLSRGFGYNSN
jgi:hypothetical protein